MVALVRPTGRKVVPLYNRGVGEEEKEHTPTNVGTKQVSHLLLQKLGKQVSHLLQKWGIERRY